MTVRLASASRLSLHLVCHSERSEESTANEEFPLTSPCFGGAETSLSLQRRGMSQSDRVRCWMLRFVQNDSASARHWGIISSIHILFRACIHLILTQPKSGLIGIARKIV
jgi:hypothetical protein